MRTILLLVSTVLLSAFLALACHAQDPSVGLAAHYPLDGDASDISGNGLDGTVVGAVPTTDRFDNAGGAFSFDGSAYITTPFSPIYDIGNALTISLWIRCDVNALNTYVLGLERSDHQEVTIRVMPNGTIRFQFRDDNHNEGFVTSPSTVIDDTWHHVTAIRDVSADQLRIYIDGVLESVETDVTVVAMNAVQSRAMAIGADNNSTFGFRLPFVGKIDDVRFYDRALTETEVLLLFGQPPIADAGPDQAIECADPDGASITLDGTGSSDPDGDSLTYTWTGPFGTATGSTPTTLLPLGTHTITLTVDDGNGGTGSDEVVITIEDTTPPAVTAVLVPVPDDDGNDDDDGYAAKNADDDDDDGDDSEVEGIFTVVCTTTDACDTNPTVTSVIVVPLLNNPTVTFKTKNKKRLQIDLEDNKVEVHGPDPQAFWAEAQAAGGVAVSDGAVLDIEQEDDEDEFEFKFDDDGHLVEVEGPSVVLRCTATDTSGNAATAEATPPLPGGDDSTDKAGDPTVQAPVVQSTIPNDFSLEQNYPNPFNPVTTIRYSLPVVQHVTVTLFDALGREVAMLVNEQKTPGRHEVVFDAGILPSGVYLYRLQAGPYTETKKLLLAK